MTVEEQAAADAAAAKAKADAEAVAKQKTYSEEELKKVIAERDKAKEKLRAIEDAEKKAQEEKAIADGHAKELLTQREAELAEANKKLGMMAEKEQKLRESYINKLTDEVDKKVAAQVTDLDMLAAFVEKSTKQPDKTFSARLQDGKLPDLKDVQPKTKAELDALLAKMGYSEA